MTLRLSPAWITALLALVILTAYESSHPHGFFYDDSIYWFLPSYELNYESLKHHHLAQINFYQFLGYAPLADSQQGLLYFPIYLAEALAQRSGDRVLGIDWLCWVHLAAAALVVERYARLFNVSAGISVLLGLFYMTQPMIFDAPQLCVELGYTYFYIPLVFLSLELFLREPTILRLFLLTLVKTLFVLSGHINYFALSLLYEAAYIGLSPFFLRRFARAGSFQGLFSWTLANVLCGLWSLPVLGPLLRHLHDSSERGNALDLHASLDLNESLFDFISVQIDHTHLSEHTILPYLFPSAWFYLGLFLLFFPLMVSRFKEREIRFFLLLFLLGLLFCTSAYALIHSLPFYNSFRYPAKNFAFSVLFYCLGLGLFLRIQQRPLFEAMLVVALMAGIAWNMVVSFGYQGSPIGTSHLFRRYDAAFHLPMEQLRESRSVLVAAQRPNPDPDLLGYLFASEAEVPVVQGYDPLISGQNYKEALETNYQGALNRDLNDEIIQHLRSWSVRYYFVDMSSPDAAHILKYPSFRKSYEIGPVAIYEDPDFVPMVYFKNAPKEPVRFAFEGNSMCLRTNGHTGTISVSLVPLQGYYWRSASDKDWKPIPVASSGRMTFTIDKPGDQVIVRYFEPFFRLFGFISAVSFLCCLAYVYIRTSRSDSFLFRPLMADIRTSL